MEIFRSFTRGNCNYTFSPVDFANAKVTFLQMLLKLCFDAKVKYSCCSYVKLIMDYFVSDYIVTFIMD